MTQQINVQELPIEDIQPSPANPRVFKENDPEFKSLIKNIKKNGLLHPVLVRPMNGKYEIVAGERRYRALKELGIPIPAIVRELSDTEAHELTVTENLQREDLTPLEESRAIQTLLNSGMEMKVIADKLGKAVSWTARRIQIAKLSKSWLNALEDPKKGYCDWTASHLELIARLEKSTQDQLLQEWSEHWKRPSPNISISDLKEKLERFQMILKSAPWDMKDTKLYKKAGACSECPKRASANPDLFNKNEFKNDQCLDTACWNKKAVLFIEGKVDVLKKDYKRIIFIGGWGEYYLPDKHPYIQNKVHSYDINITNKSDKSKKGVVPGIYVEGENFGEVVWIQEGKASNVRTDSDGNKIPTPLAERKAKHEKRRTLRFIDQVKELIEQEKKEPVLINAIDNQKLLSIIATFGAKPLTKDSEGEYYAWNDQMPLKKFSRSNKHIEEETPERDLILIITKSLFPYWLDELQAEINRRCDSPELATKMCDFLGVDHKVIRAEIKKELPDPKAWTFLNDDGTPKKKGK